MGSSNSKSTNVSSSTEETKRCEVVAQGQKGKIWQCVTPDQTVEFKKQFESTKDATNEQVGFSYIKENKDSEFFKKFILAGEEKVTDDMYTKKIGDEYSLHNIPYHFKRTGLGKYIRAAMDESTYKLKRVVENMTQDDEVEKKDDKDEKKDEKKDDKTVKKNDDKNDKKNSYYKLVVDKILQIGDELIEVVHHFQKYGISHCDLHPENIMVLKDEEELGENEKIIRIIDFDMVKQHDGGECDPGFFLKNRWQSSVYWDLRTELCQKIKKFTAEPGVNICSSKSAALRNFMDKGQEYLYADLKFLMRELQLLCIFLFFYINTYCKGESKYTKKMVHKHKNWLGKRKFGPSLPKSFEKEDDVINFILPGPPESEKNGETKKQINDRKERIKNAFNAEVERGTTTGENGAAKLPDGGANTDKEAPKSQKEGDEKTESAVDIGKSCAELFQEYYSPYYKGVGSTKKFLSIFQLFVVKSDWETIKEEISRIFSSETQEKKKQLHEIIYRDIFPGQNGVELTLVRVGGSVVLNNEEMWKLVGPFAEENPQLEEGNFKLKVSTKASKNTIAKVNLNGKVYFPEGDVKNELKIPVENPKNLSLSVSLEKKPSDYWRLRSDVSQPDVRLLYWKNQMWMKSVYIKGQVAGETYSKVYNSKDVLFQISLGKQQEESNKQQEESSKQKEESIKRKEESSGPKIWYNVTFDQSLMSLILQKMEGLTVVETVPYCVLYANSDEIVYHKSNEKPSEASQQLEKNLLIFSHVEEQTKI